MDEQLTRISTALFLVALLIGVLLMPERAFVVSEQQHADYGTITPSLLPGGIGEPGAALVYAAARNHVNQLIDAGRLPQSASAVWHGSATVSGTDYHRFALHVADTIRVRGSGLIVSTDADGAIRVNGFNLGPVPDALAVGGSGEGSTSAILASIDAEPADRPVWHGTVLDVSSGRPALLDQWRTTEYAYAVDRRTGLIRHYGRSSGHGAFLADEEPPRQQPARVTGITPTPGVRHGAHLTDEPTRVGSGLVFRVDPASGGPEMLPLPGLLGDGSRLRGQFVSVSSRLFDPDGEPTPASGATGEFVYEPVTRPDANCVLYEEDCSLIDNVNAYHHIDRYARDFWSQQLSLDINFATTVLTHTSRTGSRVHGDTIRLGSGGLFLNNNALEDDILYHEYVHVVLRHLGFAPDIFSTTQHRALSEGYADYFALTYLDRPTFANWATRCPPRYECEGPEDAQEIRTLATDQTEWNWNYGVPSVRLKYGVCTRKHLEDLKCKTSWMTFDDTYVWGMIWGSALWDIREELGKTAADELILASLALTGGLVTTFTTASGAIIRADEQLNAGANVVALRDIFSARGITPFLSAGTGTEDELAGDAHLELQVYPNPVRAEAQVSIRALAGSADRGLAHITVYDANGRVVKRTSVGITPGQSARVRFDFSDIAAGAYFVVARVGEEYAARSVTRVR